MKTELILRDSPSLLGPSELQTLKTSLEEFCMEMRGYLSAKSLSLDKLPLLTKDVKALVDLILAPREYTVDEITSFSPNKQVGMVAVLALEAVMYFSLCIYQLGPQGMVQTSEDGDTSMQELILSNKALVGEIIIDRYYERGTEKTKSFYPCGQLKITLPLEFHLTAITFFKLLCPLLKSPEKKAIIITKLITLIHMADYYVKQVRVKSMQPRIAVVGGPANSLSIIFSAGSLLESDTIFNRDGTDGRKLPINDNHLENARSIYYEHEHAIRLQHTKQDEGKGLLALAQKLQVLSPSFDSLCALVRVSDYNVTLCISTFNRFVTNCLISQCHAAADKFSAQMIERIQQQNAEIRGGLRLRTGRFDPSTLFSHQSSAISTSSILIWDSYHSEAGSEASFGYQPFLYLMEECAINRLDMLPTYLAALIDLACDQPHSVFALSIALRKASVKVKQTAPSLIQAKMETLRGDTQLSYSYFSLMMLGLVYFYLMHMNLPTGLADYALIKRITKLSMAHSVLHNTDLFYPTLLCLDSQPESAAALLGILQEDIQELCQRHQLDHRSASNYTDIQAMTLDEQSTMLSALYFVTYHAPPVEKLLLSALLFPIDAVFVYESSTLLTYISCTLNILLALHSLTQAPSDEDLLQRVTDHTTIFNIKTSASQCITDQRKLLVLQKKFLYSTFQALEAILQKHTEAPNSATLQKYNDLIEFLGSFQIHGTAFESRAPFTDHLTLYLAIRFPTHVELLELLCRQSSTTAILLWLRLTPQMRDTFCRSSTLLTIFMRAVFSLPDYINQMKKTGEKEIASVEEKISSLSEVERTGRTPERGIFSILTIEQCKEKLLKLRQKRVQLEKAHKQAFATPETMQMELFSERSSRDFSATYGLNQTGSTFLEYTRLTELSVEAALIGLLKHPKYRTNKLYMEVVTTLLLDRDLLRLVRAKAAIADINTSDPDGNALKKALEELLN